MTVVLTRVSTSAHSHSRSVTHTAEALIRGGIKIAQIYGVCEKDWADRLEVLLRGPRTWILMGHLKSFVVEIFCGDRLVNKYVFSIVANAPSNSREVFHDRFNEIEAQVRAEAAKAKATHYRFICDCAPGWEEVPGWSPCWFANDSHLQKRKLHDGFIEANSIRVEAELYTNGKPDRSSVS